MTPYELVMLTCFPWLNLSVNVQTENIKNHERINTSVLVEIQNQKESVKSHIWIIYFCLRDLEPKSNDKSKQRRN